MLSWLLLYLLTICAFPSFRGTFSNFDQVQLSKEGKAEKPPLSVFNTIVNACEICGEEDLTVRVLDTMKETHDTEGNIITTNIALKRLAKLGAETGCEGIIIGMLQAGMEPNVVSYTTAIGACATEPKNPALAYEWLQRMRSRNVKPNFKTYNTALSACLDGKLESTVTGSKIASEMLADIEEELREGIQGPAEMYSDLPDSYTKVLARDLMKQLRENWRSGDINMAVAKATLRVPLLKLVDFDKSEALEQIKQGRAAQKSAGKAANAAEDDDEDDDEKTSQDEIDLEYSCLVDLHKDGRRFIEV